MSTPPQKHLRYVRSVFAILAFIVCGAAFFGGLSVILHAQAMPALLKSITAGALLSIGFLVVLIIGTLLFGRFYCSILCPLGILQDIIGKATKRATVLSPKYTTLRYLITGIVFGVLIGGYATGLLLLDPYSTFGRLVTMTSTAGLLTLLLIVGLTLWKKRFFCNVLCPVGTVLGLLSKPGIFHLTLSDACVKCGQCKKVCPADCIDLQAGTIDNERCVRCMSCISTCPLGGITISKQRKRPTPTNASRRNFLINSATLVAGLGAGVALTKTGVLNENKRLLKTQILPPGAGNAERFSAKCTGCQLCVQVCPSKILVPAKGGIGPVTLDLSKGSCVYDCHKCSEVCPTGAILPLTLKEKQVTKIAEAHFNAKLCKVFQDDEPCGDCATACPTGAITLRKTGAPRPVKTNLCIGCGACQEACPSRHGKAMIIREIPEQVAIN